MEVSVAEEHYQFKNLKRPEATSLKEWRQRDEKVLEKGKNSSKVIQVICRWPGVRGGIEMERGKYLGGAD